MKFELKVTGPFSLAGTNLYFGGWANYEPTQSAVTMAFPVEGWLTSAAVRLQQYGDWISGEVTAANEQAEFAWNQALAVLSLNIDGQDWPQIGETDPIIGRLQTKYQFLRPVLFHSPYEAAASFVIGHRLTMQQGRTIRQSMAETFGDKVQIAGKTLFAFPRPQVLLTIDEVKGITPEKIRRLHGIAQAALDGRLDRSKLLSMPIDQALTDLRALDGVGPFFSQGILFRGAGIVDELTDDDVTRQAVQRAYGLSPQPDQLTIQHIAEAWRPYRMWAAVLLHVWLRREAGGPRRQSRPRYQRQPATHPTN